MLPLLNEGSRIISVMNGVRNYLRAVRKGLRTPCFLQVILYRFIFPNLHLGRGWGEVILNDSVIKAI